MSPSDDTSPDGGRISSAVSPNRCKSFGGNPKHAPGNRLLDTFQEQLLGMQMALSGRDQNVAFVPILRELK
jgi:hypothetical protein